MSSSQKERRRFDFGSRRGGYAGAPSTLLTGFVIQALLVVSGILSARILGVDGRGLLALFIALSVIFAHVAGTGLPFAIPYFLAGRHASPRSLAHTVTSVFRLQAIVAICLQGVAVWMLARDEPSGVLLAGLLTSLVGPMLLWQQYAMAIAQGLQQYRAFNAIRMTSTVFYAPALVVIALTGTESLTVVVAAWLFSHLPAAAYAGFYLRALTRTGESESRDEQLPLREMVRFGLKSFFASASPIDNFRLDQAAIGISLSKTDLGLYAVGLAFTNLPATFIGKSIGIVAYPSVASQKHANEKQAAIWRFVWMTSFLAGGIALLLSVLAPRLVPALFGSEFSSAVPLVRILLISAVLVGIRRVLMDGLRGAGFPLSGTIAEIASWVYLVPSLIILMPLRGVSGVAWSLVGASFFSLAALVRPLIRVTRATASTH